MLPPYLALGLAAVTSQETQAQQPDAWRVDSMDLAATVTRARRLLRISGTLELRLERGRSTGPTLVLGSGGMTFDSASVEPAARVSFSAGRDTLRVHLATPASAGTALRLSFHGHAERDLGRSPIHPEGAMISWGTLWYPVPAWHRDSGPDVEYRGTTRVTMPVEWHSLSSGLLADSSVSGGQRTEVWRMEQPTARSFIAAPFVPVRAVAGGRPVAVYLLPRHAARAREYGEVIPRMVTRLSGLFGPYPFPTFGIAELPREVAPPGFGGRSEPGYFIAHTDALDGPGVNVPLFAHELGHMWFPNATDSRPPGDDMMDEAIASYAVVFYREELESRDQARREIVDASPNFGMRAWFHEARRGADEPLMADYSPIVARAKGPMVYDMLRRRVGDSTFTGVWRDLAARGGSASLTDLRERFLARVPSDTGLRAFFSQWLDRAGAPYIEPTWSGALLTLKQRGDTYLLDLPVRVVGTRRTLDTLLRLTRRVQTVTLPVGRIRRVELDPRDDLLLWKPRFGPPIHAPASWPTARWRAWMADEVTWLMRGYEVTGASIGVIRAGRLVWTQSYGVDPPSIIGPARALADSLRASRDTTIRQQDRPGADVVLSIGRQEARAGVIVAARGGWGGAQLTLQVAQRIAIQERWGWVPR